jgi:hypothetical protein
MGAWGSSSFENDDALDFVGDAIESRDAAPAIRDALDRVATAIVGAEEGEFRLGAEAGLNAIAAAELVAACLGRPSSDLPPEAAAWCSAEPIGPAELLSLRGRALDALNRVDSATSEARALWEEAGAESLNQWRSSVDELRSRLR